MHSDAPEKVRFLEETGFHAILARELSLNGIADIRAATSRSSWSGSSTARCASPTADVLHELASPANEAEPREGAAACRQALRSLFDADGNALIKCLILALRTLDLTSHVRA